MKNMSTKKTCTQMFITLFIIATKEATQCPSTNEWIKKCTTVIQWNIFVTKVNELLIHVTPWMNLENIMLCDRSTFIIPFI
jgi:hypothetical protein